MHPKSYRLKIIGLVTALSCISPACIGQEAADSQSNEETIVLDPFNVSTSARKQYGVTSLAGATRLSTPIREIPQSVSVITSELVDALGATLQSDVVLFVPGVTPRQNVFDGTVIRSFLTFRTYNDGIRNFNGNYQSDMVNFDRIEIIKGPAAAIIGTGEPGGFVNRVSKKPLDHRHLTTKLMVGSDSLYRFELDAGGPLTEDNQVTYRAVAAYQRSDTTIDMQDIERTVFAPSVNWKMSDSTNFLLQYEFQNAHDPNDYGIAFQQFPNGTPGNPVEAKFIFPKRLGRGDTFAGNNNLIHNLRGTLVHRLNDVLTFRQVLNGFSGTVDTARAIAGAQEPQPDGGVLQSRTYDASEIYMKTFTAQSDLVAQFKLGPTNHSLLLGYEYIWNYSDQQTWRGNLPKMDLFNPVYGALPTGITLTGDALQQTTQKGFFIQEQAKLFSDRLVLTAGIRYDKASITTKNRVNNTNTRTTPIQEDWVNAPRFGATFALTDSLSVYAVHSKQTAPPEQRRRFPNSTTDQSILTVSTKSKLEEVGLKGEFLKGDLTTTLALFRLNQEGFFRNTTLPDGSQENLVVPGNEIEGVELEVIGSLTERLQMVGGYSHNFKAINSDTQLALVTTPEDKISLFLNFDVTPSFSVNCGLLFYGEQFGGAGTPTYKLSSQQRYDVGASYRYKDYTFAVSVQNITDDTFITALVNTNSSTVSPYRNIKFSVTKSW